ncbi:hypothetical protein [Streptomyces sp. CB03238]|uniref:hypothetical protein n=1 Tax=Streptomyces sp. CB03238 TaxID=1907777 RepID=UPI000A11E030|nr:hypothetical protein [Streptomyces sp. CB03238]ORT56106.1 hypothetical protein BKD26_29775 [Streptomyces sp. CB03238]
MSTSHTTARLNSARGPSIEAHLSCQEGAHLALGGAEFAAAIPQHKKPPGSPRQRVARGPGWSGRGYQRAARSAAATFAILWLSFDEALNSPDIRRYSWNIPRATVRAKTTNATSGPYWATPPPCAPRPQDAWAAQLAESLELFTAISLLGRVAAP